MVLFGSILSHYFSVVTFCTPTYAYVVFCRQQMKTNASVGNRGSLALHLSFDRVITFVVLKNVIVFLQNMSHNTIAGLDDKIISLSKIYARGGS